MTNKEYFKDKIVELAIRGNSIGVKNGIPMACNCIECYERETNCYSKGYKGLIEWSEKQYQPPKIQEEVKHLKTDDKVLVSSDGETWVKRHFAKYDDEFKEVLCFADGKTSWSVPTTTHHSTWEYAKLPEDEPEAKPEIDWAKVPVNTKILVRDYRNQEYITRRFAEYKHGKVHAWIEGKKSNETKECSPWNYAKLAEEKE